MADEKMTAGQLIDIADTAASELLDAFITLYGQAALKVLRATKQAKDEGMADERILIGLRRFMTELEDVGPRIEKALDDLVKAEGLTEVVQ